MDAPDYSALDEALEILKPYGPEYGGGLTNHAPMAVEALCALGRGDSVLSWVDEYRKGLLPRTASRDRIDAARWQAALGDYSRVAEWMALFENEMKERPWRDVLAMWLPRLAPGLIAAATHGPIRVGHAVRSLGQSDTAQRRLELADGLGYWAATYHVLPERVPSVGGERLKPSQAISMLQILPPESRGKFRLISEALAQLDSFSPFAGAADLVDSTVAASEFLSDLTAAFARVYLANAGNILGALVFIHSVTGPSALRPMLPYLSPSDAAPALRYAWQAAAALFTVFAMKAAPEGPIDAAGVKREDLIADAIDCGDEHAIKFTEVCLREYWLNPQPEYLAAARHAIGVLRQ